MAIAACFLIVDWPDQAKFLTPREKELLRARLDADAPKPDGLPEEAAAESGICSNQGSNGNSKDRDIRVHRGVATKNDPMVLSSNPAQMDKLTPFALRLILTDWKIPLAAFAYMGVGTAGYGLTFFLPTILHEFGWTAETAQIYTIPVYAASAVAMLTVAWLSDRAQHRYGFVMLGCVVTTAGLAVLLASSSYPDLIGTKTKYAAVFLVAMGGFTATPLPLAWLANNVSGHWKRSFASGIQVTIGNLAGIIGTNIFLAREAPGYRTGYAVTLTMTWTGALCATAMAVLLWRENRARDRGARDDRLIPSPSPSASSTSTGAAAEGPIHHESDGRAEKRGGYRGVWRRRRDQGTPASELGNLGDWHPAFRFTL